ncbi:uncharacterized protein LOC129980404 isoform X2 [Argiope bruennichi]|uniref:uncharacterized protein LOC129980404 isoform X2 n=1 Tax=Argiope bruennichi TaxID=94029 RepID=UPI0024952322|nr:uncharacterized protein LOC129980404 isoform X2 [Argiope bruennichi]
MDDSKKSKIFTFGQLEKPEDSASEESLSDSSDDDSISKNEGGATSSKTNESDLDLVKQMQKLTNKMLLDSSSTSDSNDFFKRRMMDYNGSNTDETQSRSRNGIYSARRNLFGQDQRLRGNWTFRCDIKETNSDGLTEGDLIWIAVNELFEKEAEVFTIRPEKFSSRSGFLCINIYTPDYRDEKFILKTANIIRRHVYFPYVMYYYKSSGKSTSIYMHTPNGEFYRKTDDNRWTLIDWE